MTRRRPRRGLVAAALSDWRECRADFELVRAAAYERAEEACRGRMLNPRGVRAGVDSYSLFIGPEARAVAYASEELVEHWRTWPRPVFERFEREWMQLRDTA